MELLVGSVARVRATNCIGIVSESNGHAYKINETWFHRDDVSAGPMPTKNKQRADELWAQAVYEFRTKELSTQLIEVISLMQQSLEFDSSCPQRHYFVGVLFSMQHSPSEAIRSFEFAVRLEPSFKLAYLEMVLLLEAEHRLDDVRRVVASAIDKAVYWSNEWQYCPMFSQGLCSKPWWSSMDFPWAEGLESSYPDIKEELLTLINVSGTLDGWPKVDEDDATGDAMLVASGGTWQQFNIFGAGFEDNDVVSIRQKIPKTCRILEQLLPGAVAMAKMGAGEIIFSALAPGTKLLPHCGSSNVRLTCHLGLICPEGARIRVGSTWNHWAEGKCLFFDDSFEHEIVHDGHGKRVVLLVRFWHPDLPPDMWQSALEAGYGIFEELAQKRQDPPMTEEVVKLLEELSSAADAKGCAVVDNFACL